MGGDIVSYTSRLKCELCSSVDEDRDSTSLHVRRAEKYKDPSKPWGLPGIDNLGSSHVAFVCPPGSS